MRRQPSLRSQLNQIRLWVRQGRTDAWIAHKLDVSVDELSRFKREHALDNGDDRGSARPADPLSVPPPEPRAVEPEAPEEDDDAYVESEEPLRARPRRRSRRRPSRVAAGRDDDMDEEDEELSAPVVEPERDEDDEDDAPPRRRRRGRRGGRRHRSRGTAYEATFDHGEEGYGLWLDPSVADNPVYSEHWAGHRAVTVTLEAEAITIRRAPAGEARPTEDDEPDSA